MYSLVFKIFDAETTEKIETSTFLIETNEKVRIKEHIEKKRNIIEEKWKDSDVFIKYDLMTVPGI
jgi:hypothetical protein